MKKHILAFAAIALILSACQAKQPSAAPSTVASPTPVVTPQPTVVPTPTPTPTPSPSPSPTAPAKTYKMNSVYDIVPIDPNVTNKKVVLLTFDDGPKKMEWLEPLLDTLDKHKAKAIFFVNGYRVKENPELLKLIADRGQIIGNHSWDHIDLKKEADAKVDDQITTVQQIVKETIGVTPQFFRPPYGSSNAHVKEKVKSENMLFMTWSDGSLDWDLPSKLDDKGKTDAIIENVFKLLHPGSNILMHELPWTVNTLDQLLTKLEEKGYGFVDPRSIETASSPTK